MSGYYFEVRLSLPQEAREAVAAELFDAGAAGLLEEGEDIVLYFDGSHSEAELQKTAEAVVRAVCGGSIPEKGAVGVKRCLDQDWNAEWKKGWRPLRIGERLMIKPSWLDVPPDAPALVIEIDPEMAFGTGDHPTTQLVLRMMETIVRPGIRLLDVGCGTGILAIAGIKLGAAHAVAFDIDPIAAETTRRNAEINGTADRLTVFAGSIEALGPQTFELIVANVNRTQLVLLMPSLSRRLTMSGKCLLSGIFYDEEEAIREACAAAGLIVRRVLREKEWLAFETEKG